MVNLMPLPRMPMRGDILTLPRLSCLHHHLHPLTWCYEKWLGRKGEMDSRISHMRRSEKWDFDGEKS